MRPFERFVAEGRRSLALLAALLAVGASQAAPAAPRLAPRASAVALPQDRLLFDSNRTGTYEIWSMRTDGTDPVQLTDDARYDSWWPKISPDRTRIVFYRTPAGVHDRDYALTSLWSMASDGSDLREMIPNKGYGWAVQGHAEWSPDGARLVMFAGVTENPQLWITDAEGRSPTRITNRPGTNVDPSWTPDGRILFAGCPIAACTFSQLEIYRINADGTGELRLTDDLIRDHDPYMSPDGTTIAWLREKTPPLHWSIYRMRPDGSDERPVIDDLAINSKPGWSLDSKTIYFHRTPFGRTLFNVFAISPDGTGLRELEFRHPIGFGAYDNEYPVHSPY